MNAEHTFNGIFKVKTRLCSKSDQVVVLISNEEQVGRIGSSVYGKADRIGRAVAGAAQVLSLAVGGSQRATHRIDPNHRDEVVGQIVAVIRNGNSSGIVADLSQDVAGVSQAPNAHGVVRQIAEIINIVGSYIEDDIVRIGDDVDVIACKIRSVNKRNSSCQTSGASRNKGTSIR